MGFKDELLAFSHAKITFDQPMKKITALGVGGNAKYLAVVDSLYSLNFLVQTAKRFKIPFKVFGNGTNLLVSDKGYDGLIIKTGGLCDVFFKRDQVRAMAGANLDAVIKFATEHRLSGLEPLAGIPATVGGAVVMNAGAFGRSISDCITTVETLKQGKIKVYDKNQCAFGYRKSRFLGKKEVVVSATFNFSKREREKIIADVKRYSSVRKSIQPIGKSCGSVFKNPIGQSAGLLIDKAGLKGLKIGGAQISMRHGNFILTDNTATACDVYQLIRTVKEKINELFGVTLSEEVEYVGEF